MADVARTTSAISAPLWLSVLRQALANPAILLVIVSAFFGTVMVFLNPPLRGPDEPAHFVRVYSYAHGVVLPALEIDGRKGIHLPADLHDDYAFFNEQRGKIWTPGFHFGPVYEAYREQRASVAETDPPRAPVFVPYEGTEGYTPAAYAPHIAAALVARVFGLDFLGTIQLMRLAGLAVFTAIAAYAIAVTPHLKWAFFLIALLPASLYGRAVVGADGATISFSLLVTAMALRAALGDAKARMREPRRVLERAVWMTLCVLSKPPQIVFVLLEPMIVRFRDLPRHWRIITGVVAPGLILAPLWLWAVDAEMAAWRLYANGEMPREYFSFSYKLGFMLENPLHFPGAVLATLTGEAFGLWRQLIGVLGWLDTHLSVPVYIAISAALLATFAERIEADRATRLRIALHASATFMAYVVVVFLIFFITWTPPTETTVWGVQGRYFVVVLPPLAVAAAALANVGLPKRFVAGAAVIGAVVGGIASIEGLWRVNWAG